ncbi:MAG: lysophospholipid acyltransferase family protein [bacterium]
MKNTQIFIRSLIYISVRILHVVVSCLPWNLSVRIGSVTGFISYYLLRAPRRIVCSNLALAFIEKSPSEIKKIAREVFSNQGENLFELLSFGKLNAQRVKKLVNAQGLEHLDKALEKKKGVLLLSGHIGNWELLGAYLSLVGYPISVIARRVYDERLNKLLVDIRQSKGVMCVLRDESSKQLLRCLRSNRALGVLIDQDTKVQGVFVDFFGRKAYTPQGLATLALRTGAAVVPSFIVRDGYKHKIILKEELSLTHSGDEAKDLEINTQTFTKIIEEVIRQHPSQWVWMHERWKTRPEDIADK